MKKRNAGYVIRNALVIIILASSMAFAVGQSGVDLSFLGAGVGARPLGMGGAFVAVADNADSPFWNPAGIIKKSEITTMTTKLSSDSDHYYMSYVLPVFKGTVGISWIQVGTGNISQTSKEVDNYNEVYNLGVFSSFSNAYMLSYAREINDNLSLGVTGKYLTTDMTNVLRGQGYGYSITPGILIRITNYALPITIGCKIDELVNQQSWGTGTVEKVPPKLRLGFAYKMLNPGLFALDISQILRNGYAAEVAAGYEWSKEGLSVRVGYSEGITAGAGFETGHTKVDYAYVSQRDLSKDNVHRISLTGKW